MTSQSETHILRLQTDFTIDFNVEIVRHVLKSVGPMTF